QATLVKLTRVVLLAPMVAGVGVWRRRSVSEALDTARPPIVPLFVVGFLAMIGLRATGWLPDGALDAARTGEQAFLTAGMFGLGAGVEFARLRRLGGRPLVLGLGSWVIVAGLALGASYLIA
ncbi:MAG: putative sulfate exporter family transporter, partial [Ilumatobacteraceae bacterium]